MTLIMLVCGSISPLITCEKTLAVQPETSATPCRLILTGCCWLRDRMFQNTTRGSS